LSEVQIEIDDVGRIGVVRDAAAHQLPPEAWTLAENVRYSDASVARVSGETQVFGTPGVAPYFAQYVSSASQPWWLYAGLAKIYVYDGSAHTNITRQSAGVDVDYTATGALDWNGTLLGGIPILNNGQDVPQFWAAYSAAQKMANLTNWPGTLRAKVIRAFGPYLLACNLTDAGVAKPHDVRWSKPADPGFVPGSWDITDPSTTSGQVSLPDVDSGFIVDALPLQGRFYVYKENGVWRFRNVGGRFIFDEDSIFENIGLLCARCVAVTGDGQKHFFVSNDNAYLHDGNKATPLWDEKVKRYVFNQLDVANYKNSFVGINAVRDEAWFCYPQAGSTLATRGIITNYRTGAITETDIDFQSMMVGTLQSSDTETWAAAVGTWDTDSSPWSVSNRRKMLLCKPSATKFLQLDLGTQRDSSDFTGLVQRTSLGVVGRDRKGNWIEDFEVRKLVTRIWPKMSGGPVNIRLGGQDVPNGIVRWSDTKTFDPATQKYCDIVAEGAAICVEISGAVEWQLDGYKLDMITLGRF
jgi:hypothetical protein